jgi:hypothetical protein
MLRGSSPRLFFCPSWQSRLRPSFLGSPVKLKTVRTFYSQPAFSIAGVYTRCPSWDTAAIVSDVLVVAVIVAVLVVAVVAVVVVVVVVVSER